MVSAVEPANKKSQRKSGTPLDAMRVEDDATDVLINEQGYTED
jgi:hypothetical protein